MTSELGLHLHPSPPEGFLSAGANSNAEQLLSDGDHLIEVFGVSGHLYDGKPKLLDRLDNFRELL
jgi:hypothetical protein